MSKQDRPMTAEISDDGSTVTVDKITRANGVAGEISVTAHVTYTYPDAPDERDMLTLVGSAFGGPVVAVLSSTVQTFVRNPERFGSFSADPREYIRRYVLNEV